MNPARSTSSAVCGTYLRGLKRRALPVTEVAFRVRAALLRTALGAMDMRTGITEEIAAILKDVVELRGWDERTEKVCVFLQRVNK